VNASSAVLWAIDGVPICTAAEGQHSPKPISDGVSGAIIMWRDIRNGNNDGDIYVQRVDAGGTVLWATDGIPIVIEPYLQTSYIVSDRSGGAIITWMDYRNDIYAQRIDAGGILLWTADGIPITTVPSIQAHPQPVSDGAGGAIITWEDYRSGNYDVYAQRLNASGAVLWTTDGVPISTAANDQRGPQLVSDGTSGALITWWDSRSGTNSDIYAQNVNPDGTLGGISGDGLSALAAAPIRPGVQVTPQPLKAEPSPIPLVTRAFQNYPNPFNPETWLPYQLADDAPVTLKIYSLNGRLIRTLALGVQKAGVYLTRTKPPTGTVEMTRASESPAGSIFTRCGQGNLSPRARCWW